MHWLFIYFGCLAGTCLLSLILTAFCRKAAFRLGYLDVPMAEAHKLHREPVPVLGGPAMFFSWVLIIWCGLACAFVATEYLPADVAVHIEGVKQRLFQLSIICAGAAGLVLLGLFDDRFGMRAHTKFLGQALIAGLTAAYGVRITMFWTNPLITWTITTIWILCIINALNFLDNMDGLAAGLAFVAACLFTFVAVIREQHFVAVLGAATAGSALGFLYHNKPPAKIFMGDAGSHFLGYVLALLGALTTFYRPEEAETPAPILIPLLILGVPLFDMMAVILIRVRKRKPVWIGDHWHISHRFTKMGLSRGKAVFIVHLLSFTIGAGAITLLWLPMQGIPIVFLQCLAVLTIISFLQSFTIENEE